MLTVIDRAPHRNHKGFWNCVCNCGRPVVIAHRHLQSKAQKSCGCMHTTHGMTHSPEFRAWQGMNSRCHIPSAGNYHCYGARGISVCARWRNSFMNFFVDVGSHPGKGYSLERNDVNGNYEPCNVRWATAKEQGQNRRTNKFTPESVREARSLYASGVSVIDIAKHNSAASSAVYYILSRRTWSNI